ncbi:hypothetical protein AGMMS50212_09110 [Spirochaetia bacterium]|nr:hypothetical protein AGMMS50212_09110 [Spirochaetia bacterium]
MTRNSLAPSQRFFGFGFLPMALFVVFASFAALPSIFADDAPYVVEPFGFNERKAFITITEEIENAKAILRIERVDPKERHAAYSRLGRLLYLLGDIESSAHAWEQAAFAIPDKRDDMALLESASCNVAMGELSKAEASVKLVLLSVRGDKRVLLKAKYLNAQIEAFRFSNPVILDAYLTDPEFVYVRPALYYTLWKITGSNEYKTKLITEYPESPETRILFVNSGAVQIVHAAPAAQWLLFPGRENVRIEELSAAPAKAPHGYIELASPPSLQTGLFNNQENALIQVRRLQAAGFSAGIVRRMVAGSSYWAVAVPSGANMSITIAKLKNAGFESFPIF